MNLKEILVTCIITVAVFMSGMCAGAIGSNSEADAMKACSAACSMLGMKTYSKHYEKGCECNSPTVAKEVTKL